MIYSHTPIYKSKKKRNPLMFLTLSFILLLIGVISLSFFLTDDTKREIKPFFQATESPIVIAHRGGSTYPENTLQAFKHSEEIGVDVLEFDIHMTIDGHLVVLHDETVDRTTNGTGRIDAFTIEEVKRLDAGFSFVDSEGKFIYRNQGFKIPTVEEVFSAFSHLPMNIEIKPTQPEIAEKLWLLIQEYDMQDKVLLASFDQKIIDHFQLLTNDTVAISGGKSEVTKFVLLHKLRLGRFYSPSVDVIQIPTKANCFHLIDQHLISRAQSRIIQIHYWTINDEETMRQLLQLGADGIITDKPELLINLLQEMGIRK